MTAVLVATACLLGFNILMVVIRLIGPAIYEWLVPPYPRLRPEEVKSWSKKTTRSR